MNMDMKFPPMPKSETEGMSQPSTMYLKLILAVLYCTAIRQFPDCYYCIGPTPIDYFLCEKVGPELKAREAHQELISKRWQRERKRALCTGPHRPLISNCIYINAIEPIKTPTENPTTIP